MAEVKTFACDICGKLKSNGEQWYEASFAGHQVMVVPLLGTTRYADGSTLCSKACVTQWQDPCLDQIKADRESIEVKGNEEK